MKGFKLRNAAFAVMTLALSMPMAMANDVIKMGYADTPNGQVHYRYVVGDDASKPVLMMIHQTTSDSSFWDKMLPLMKKEYSAIYCPDFPGYGGFSPTDEQVKAKGLSFYGDVFVDFMKSLKLDQNKIHLAGHYTGGSIALDMKTRYPDLFKSLIIMGTVYGDQEFRKRLRSVTVGSIEKIRPQRDGSHLMRGWKQVEEYGAAHLPLELHQREALINMRGWKATNQAYSAVLDYDFIKDFDKVPTPLMIMDGEHGQLIEFFNAAKKARPDAKVVLIKGTHDYFPYEAPQKCVDAVVSFTKSVDNKKK